LFIIGEPDICEINTQPQQDPSSSPK